MKVHRISENHDTHRCPSCDIPLTAATGVENENKPEEGDISICFNCGEILTFNVDLTQSKISYEKLLEIKTTAPEEFLMIKKISQQIKNGKI